MPSPDSRTRSAPAALLDGLRVLDLSGPQGQLCSRLLADLGADVIKPEPTGGDPVRGFAPFGAGAGPETSLPFAFLNAGKRSIMIDPVSGEDAELVRDLCSWAEVIVMSADGALGKEVIPGPQQLQEETGKIVVAVSPFGLGSPHNDAQTDLTIYALSGLLNMSGSPDLPPCAPPESQAYYFGSVWAAVAALSAYHRPTPGGELIDVSLCESETTQEALVRAAATGNAIERGGSQHRLVCPSNLFATQDGLVQFHVNHTAWRKFLHLLDGRVPELEDERWNSMDTRLAHVDHVNALIEAFTRTCATADLVEDAQRNGVACMPVNQPTDVLADDGMLDRGTFVTVDHPVMGRYVQPATPYLIDGARLPGSPPPLLDADREAIRAAVADRQRQAPPVAAASPPTASEAPLAGVRVVTFTSGVAGPRAGRILAWLGAEVVKVESRNGGVDSFRYFGTSPDPDLHLETSQRYAEGNLNVRSVTLDLKSSKGQQMARELIASCDVVMDNFRPGVLDRLGLSDEDIAEHNPRCIVMHMPGFGSTGRRRGFGTWGPSVNAFTGITALWNHPDQGSVIGTQGVYPDYLASVFGPLGIVAALISRHRSGRAVRLEYSQVEGAVFMLGVNYLYASVHGQDRPPEGNNRDNCLASGLLRCIGDDRWCAYELRDEADLASVVGLLIAEAATEPGLDRSEVPDLAEAISSLQAWAQELPPGDVMAALAQAGVPAGVVRKGAELLDDPVFDARGFIRTVDQPHIGAVTVPYLPVQFRYAQTIPPVPAPQLGQHNEQFLCGLLGYDAEELVALQESGVVA